MPYELHVNASISGAQQADQLGGSLNTVAGRTEYLDQKIRQLVGGNDLLLKSIELQKETLQTLRMQLELMASSAEKASQTFTRMGSAARGSVSEIQAVSGALRTLEGVMPIRAAERFLTLLPGISTALTTAFPVFGMVAFGEVMGHMVESVGKLKDAWDPVIQAQKASNELLKESTGEIQKQSNELRDLQIEHIARTQGPVAAAGARAADYEATARYSGAERVRQIQSNISVLQKIALGQPITEHELAQAKGAGLPVPWWQLERRTQPTGWQPKEEATITFPYGREASAANTLLTGQMNELHSALQAQELLHAKADDERERGAAEAAAEAAKKSQQAAASEARQNAQGERQDQRRRERTEHLLTQLNSREGHEREREDRRMNEQITRIPSISRPDLDLSTHDIERQLSDVHRGLFVGRGELNPEIFGLPSEPLPYQVSLLEQLRRFTRSGTTQLRSLQRSGANPDEMYQARIAQADQEYSIEQKIAEEKRNGADREQQRLDSLDKLREKYAQAETQREDALEALREKDLHKYEQMADSLFDAIHGRSMPSWTRNFLTGQARQLFSNVATPVLQTAGHAIGGLIPNVGPLGTLLHGTILDNQNTGTAAATITTAQQTRRTADEVHALRGDLKGIFTGSNNPDATVTPGSAYDINNLPMTGPAATNPFGTDIALYGNDVAGWMAGAGSSGTSILGSVAALASPLSALAKILGPNGGPIASIPTVTPGGAVSLSSILPNFLAGTAMLARGIGSGGVTGDLDLAGGATSIAGGILPMISASLGATAGPIGLAAGGLLSLIGSLFQTGPQQRVNQITNELAQNQYLAPTALNVMQGMNGTYEDFDARGNLRTSTMSAVPTVAEPYIWKQTHGLLGGQPTYYNVPGGVTSPYSGYAVGSGNAPVSNSPIVNAPNTSPSVQYVTIHAMDSQSFADFAQSNHMAIGEAVATHLQNHEGRASNAIRHIT